MISRIKVVRELYCWLRHEIWVGNYDKAYRIAEVLFKTKKRFAEVKNEG